MILLLYKNCENHWWEIKVGRHRWDVYPLPHHTNSDGPTERYQFRRTLMAKRYQSSNHINAFQYVWICTASWKCLLAVQGVFNWSTPKITYMYKCLSRYFVIFEAGWLKKLEIHIFSIFLLFFLRGPVKTSYFNHHGSSDHWSNCGRPQSFPLWEQLVGPLLHNKWVLPPTLD